jgi:hypothetical protein
MKRERDWLPKGSRHWNAKLTEYDVKLILELDEERREIRQRLQDLKIAKIAEKFDVSATVISRIVNGHEWRHV